jgi:type IV fimbrial biogenesis protein FimT
MVTIAVAAILVTVGVPGFRALVQNNRVTTQTNELVSALNVGRAEAVKRGRNIEVTVTQQATGWSATVRIPGPGTVLREVNRAGSTINVTGSDSSATQTTVVFGPTGAPVAGETFDLQPKSNCSGQQSRRITVGVSGQITTTRQNCQT